MNHNIIFEHIDQLKGLRFYAKNNEYYYEITNTYKDIDYDSLYILYRPINILTNKPIDSQYKKLLYEFVDLLDDSGSKYKIYGNDLKILLRLKKLERLLDE